jgi:biopolymer transport protein TolR
MNPPPRGKRKPMAEINVVPYIDVMLVLLIIFMVTAPLLMQGVKVDLPKAPSVPFDDKDNEPLIVSIKADGQFFINLGEGGDQAMALEAIVEQVGKILRQKPETPVLIWGDKAIQYGVVVNVMSQLQGAGAPSVGLVTEPGNDLKK